MVPTLRCALCITVLCSQAGIGFAPGHPAAADEFVPEEFPQIEVPRLKLGWLRTDPQPQPFAGALTYLNEQRDSIEAGRLQFTVKRGGVILLQASWEDDADSSGDWKSEVVTREQLGQTWFDLGPAPWDEHQVLLMRECKAGETYSIRTRKYNPPQPILVSKTSLAYLQKGGLSAREALIAALRKATEKPPTRVSVLAAGVPEGAAVLDVEAMKLSALDGQNIPPYLRGAMIYRQDPSQESGHPGVGVLRFRVLRGGQVFLLATWKHDADAGDWRQSALSYRQLSVDWAPLGRCPWDPDYWLFVRDCEAGEEFKLRTRTYRPPLPIVAPPVDLLAEAYADLVPVQLREQPVRRQIRHLLAEENYAELERLASEFRQSGATFPSAHSRLAVLYGELSRVEKRDVQHYTDRIAQLEKWVAASGKSLAARVALVRVLTSYAYFVRGGKLSSKVSERQFEGFHEHLTRARQILLDVEQDAPGDVGYYAERIRIAQGLGASRDDVLRWTAAAAERDPWNSDAVYAAATFFLPRWHGEDGDLVKLAEALVEATRDECGEALYAQVVMGVRAYTHRRTFVEDRFSWERTRQGLAEQRKRFPGSAYLLNVQCQLACLAFDRELAQACFAEIGDDPDLNIWDAIEAYEMQRRVFSPENFAGDQDRVWMVHADGARYARFSPDGTKLLTSGHDSLIKVWDAASGKELRRRALMGSHNCIDFLNDETIMIGDQYGDLDLWRWGDDEIQQAGHLPQRIVSLDCSPDGRHVFFSDAHGNCIVVDLRKKQRVLRGEQEHGRFSTGAFSPDSRFLATTGSDGRIVIHNLEVGRPESTFAGDETRNEAIAFSPDGTLIATGDEYGLVRVKKVDGWKGVAITHRDGGRVRALAFSPDGKQLVIARGGGTHLETGGLWICTVAGRTEERRIAGHATCVHDVGFAPDGKSLLSVGADWTLRLYGAAKLQPQ